MFQYIYTLDEAGFSQWPDGQLRLAGIPETRDPSRADVFVCKAPLSSVHHRFGSFPHFKGNESKHVFLDISEHITTPLNLPCIFIRCAMTEAVRRIDSNSIAWPWPVDDLSECLDLPKEGFQYCLSFHGWLSTEARSSSSNSCRNESGLVSDIRQYSDFYGTLSNPAEQNRRRLAYRKSLKESRIALCPESIAGILPYRFYEAMSAGRVPMIVGSGYVLPFKDRIPYEEFCIFCESSEAKQAGRIAKEFIHQAGDIIEELGRMARLYWKAYIDPDHWDLRFAEEVIRQIENRKD